MPAQLVKVGANISTKPIVNCLALSNVISFPKIVILPLWN